MIHPTILHILNRALGSLIDLCFAVGAVVLIFFGVEAAFAYFGVVS